MIQISELDEWTRGLDEQTAARALLTLGLRPRPLSRPQQGPGLPVPPIRAWTLHERGPARSASLGELIRSITALDSLDSSIAHYVALRLGEPDACPTADLALRRVLPRHARQRAAAFGDLAER